MLCHLKQLQPPANNSALSSCVIAKKRIVVIYPDADSNTVSLRFGLALGSPMI